MSQIGGGPILQYYRALNDAIQQNDANRFEAELATLRQYIAHKQAEFPGINGPKLLLQYLPDEDLQDQGKSRTEMERIYNDVWRFYDGSTQFPEPAPEPVPEPQPEPVAEDYDMAQLQSEVQAALDAKGEETRQCQEALAAAQARLQEVLAQKEQDRLLLAEKVRELGIWEGNVEVTEGIIFSKESEIHTLTQVNAALSAEDSEKEAAISKLIQLEHETAQQALALQQKLSEETDALETARYLYITYEAKLVALESAFKALNLPDRPSNQALAEFRQGNSRLLANLIAEEKRTKKPLNELQLSLKQDLESLESLEPLESPRTIEEEVAYTERQRERLVTDLKTLRTAYLAKCVELSAKVREVQQLQGKLGNALADAHVNMQLYKTQLDKNAQLKSDNVSLSEKVGDLEKDTELLSKSYGEQYGRNEQLKGENEQLRTILESVQEESSQLEESKTLIERKVQQKLADLEGSLAEARAAYLRVKQGPKETNVQISDFLSAGGMLLFLLQIKSALLTDSEDQALDREIADVQAELGQANTLAKEKLKQCDDLVKTNSILLGRIQALQEQVGTSTEFLRQGIARVLEENTSTQGLIARITAQPPDSAEVQALRAQLAGLTNSSPVLQQQLEQVQQQIQALGQGIQAQQQAAGAAGGNPQQFQQQIQASLQQYTASAQQYQQLVAQAQAATGRAAALQASVSQFDARIADCERRVSQKEGERAAATQAATALQQRLQQLTAEKTVVDQARVEADRQRALLEGQMRSAAAVVAAAQQRATGAEQRERDLQQRLERERNPVNIQQLQGVLQGLVVQRQQIEQEAARALERQQGLEQRVMAAEVANAHYAVHSANLSGELGRQQEVYNTVQAQAQAAIQQATAQARQEAAAALAAQAAQAEQFEARLQASVQAAVAAAQAQAIAAQGARDTEHQQALAALMVQIEGMTARLTANREAAEAARLAAVETQRAAVAAETVRATAEATRIENTRLLGLFQRIVQTVQASEVPGAVAAPPLDPNENTIYTAITAAKQRQRAVDQVQIDRLQAILNWHTDVQVEFNPALPAPLVIGTLLRFTLRNRGVHAIAFFRYPEGTDYIDVHDDIPKTHIVRPNFQGYGAFNVN
jgi:hypothetical protein